MAWTKTQLAVVTGAALILATGAGRVFIKVADGRQKVHLAPNALPQTPEELDAWYGEPPAGQNAATFELQGFAALQINGADKNPDLPVLGGAALPPSPATPLPPAMQAALAAFLPANQRSLQSFAQAARHDQSRYPIDLSRGSETTLPHLIMVKQGSQLAQLAAVWDTANGDADRAAADLRSGLGLAGSLKAEPVLISQLVRAASMALAANALERTLNQIVLPPEAAAQLADAFQTMADYDARGDGFNRALIGEQVNHRAMLKNPAHTIKVLNNLLDSGIPEEQRRQIQADVQQPGQMKKEQAFLEAAYRQILAARQLPFPERLQTVTDAVRRQITDATDQGLVINALLLAGLDAHVRREASCLANTRLARTALALEQFRAAHHRYPAALSELCPACLPELPLDPFDGQPLRYQPRAAGYLLYSIGSDLKDDGGRRMKANIGDWVFEIIKPPDY